LEKDREVAEREGLTLALEQGDMRDLSRFPDEWFSLIFHPTSNCFVDDILAVWRESYRVLKQGGILLSGFCNPVTFIFDLKEWDDHKNLVVRYKIPYSDLQQLPKEELDARINAKETLEFGHSLEDQIGGQIAAGFSIQGFYEDSSGGDLLDSYLNTFIATKAIKGSPTS
jgi:SAM-dependent methyltransferase